MFTTVSAGMNYRAGRANNVIYLITEHGATFICIMGMIQGMGICFIMPGTEPLGTYSFVLEFDDGGHVLVVDHNNV